LAGSYELRDGVGIGRTLERTSDNTLLAIDGTPFQEMFDFITLK
jgi:hypothetical protein